MTLAKSAKNTVTPVLTHG